MKIVGIDPGSHRTGFGVIEAQGTSFRCLDAGVIAAGEGELPLRLCRIADSLELVLRRHAPDAVAVETVFFAKNSQSALALGQARGVALLIAARAGAQVFEYTAGQIKQATVGRGRAEKEQVRAMVTMLLGLQKEPLGLDASDALAAAICHAQAYSSPVQRLLASGGK